ncbi:TonB-dependent receptor [uncultured Pseudoteredinibacter sp.]|uniref:TonB-dependent receptor n=1 Tax=uncultured Pseudoteredinibacter sp. TaxID=1641701 RepID=UPI002610C5E1|nr:TonB-dependent receptor [uncultured Pseudoteredinibacter sp.]
MNHVKPLALAIVALTTADSFAASLEEVVVTAQKREQSLLDVSASIDAFSETDIEELGINQAANIAQYSPGLYVKPTVGDQNPVFTIRGIGFNDFTSIQNPGAAVYVNSVVVPYHPMMSFQLLDVQQVEVLKGPQGTLYGRNSTAGAITFVTREPGEELNGYLNLEAGEHGLKKVETAIGGPISDQFSARLAMASHQTDGYQTNRTNNDNEYGGKDRQFARLSLVWDNGETSKVALNLHGGRDTSEAVALEHLSSVDPATGEELCAPVAAGNRAEGACTNVFGYFDPDSDPFAGDYSVSDGGVDNSAVGISLTVEHDLNEALSLVSVTGYDRFDRYQLQDIDASPLQLLDVTFDDLTKAFSQEFRLSGEYENGTWIAGVYYSQDEISASQHLNANDIFSGANIVVINNQDSNSFAAFTHIEHNLDDQNQLVVGLRYTDEEKDWNGGTDALPLGQNFSSAKVSDTDISGLIAYEYTPSDDSVIYASLSKGFRSGGFPGGFNLNPLALQPFNQEEVFAYEAGAKMKLFDNSLSLSGAIFYYDWKDLQTQTTTVDETTGIAAVVLSNAGDAEIKGIELNTNWQISEFTQLRSGMAYITTEIVKSEDPSLRGKELANSPELTFNMIFRHSIPLGDYSLGLQADTSFTDERFFTSANIPVFHGDSYWLSNAKISLSPTDESWTAYIHAKNISDETYRVEGFSQFGFSGDSYHYYGEPRTISAGFNLRF